MTLKKNKTIAIGIRMTLSEYNKMVVDAKKWCKERGISYSYSAFARSRIKGIK